MLAFLQKPLDKAFITLKVSIVPSKDVKLSKSKKLNPSWPLKVTFRGIIAFEVPLSEVTISGWAVNTTSISSKIPCLT